MWGSKTVWRSWPFLSSALYSSHNYFSHSMCTNATRKKLNFNYDITSFHTKFVSSIPFFFVIHAFIVKFIKIFLHNAHENIIWVTLWMMFLSKCNCCYKLRVYNPINLFVENVVFTSWSDQCLAITAVCTFGYLWPLSVYQWAINCHSVKMYHWFVLSPHLNCLVYEARESIKMTRWAQSLLLLKTGCKSRRLYCHFTHLNDTGHFNTHRSGRKKQSSTYISYGLAGLEKQEATVFIKEK